MTQTDPKVNKKHIDEISMLRGIGVILVIVFHMGTVSGAYREFETVAHLLSSICLPLMLLFFIVSGYTASARRPAVVTAITARARRILVPYYGYTIPMIIVFAVIGLLIEKRSLAWFADGTIGVLFQYQSFHGFESGATGVHLMFYSVLVGWFLFQMLVSDLLFIPLLYFLKDKKNIWKLLSAIVLLMIGAVLYKLNLQGLNGEFFPKVCKIFILPNIPGIAGLMMIGKYVEDMSLFDLDLYSGTRKAVTALVSLGLIIVFVMTDDYIYDFPIGKWGAFGSFSYFTAPVYGMALVLLLGIICNAVKKCLPIRNVLIGVGNNSMDYVMLHLFIAYLTAYIGGFWYEYLSEPVPTDDLRLNFLHLAILLVSVFTISYFVVKIKKHAGGGT